MSLGGRYAFPKTRKRATIKRQFPEVSFAKLSRIDVRVAKWQKEQIKKAMDLGEPPYLISIEQAYYRTLKLFEESNYDTKRCITQKR